jgi:Spy/CpxP family protein refolding chaperone
MAMISLKFLALGLGMLAVAGAAGAAERSPYAGWQERTIKALSPQQVADYLEGRGMSMALPAELNGYPGPRHVLELAEKLGLTVDQLARTQRLFEDMRLKAIELGQQIVEGEAALDELFASATASATSLRDATRALGLLNGQLRAHHLGYHLAMRDLLQPDQIESYQRLRGYASPTAGGHGGGRHGHGAP